MSRGDLLRERDFYGVVRVRSDEQMNILVHGITNHGIQYRDPAKRLIPTSYFWRESGFGLVMRNHPKYGREPMRVGVLGLGVGVMAAYGNEGDSYRFYEISPIVQQLAEGRGGYFSFLNDTPASVEVILGDARISLENEPPQNYDLLAIDTFSSDAIPVHLVTREAFELYLRHLAPDGVLIVQITNNHLNLRPVIWQIGQELGLSVALFNILQIPADHPEAFPSQFIALSRDPAYFDAPEIAAAADRMENFETSIRLWTDDYSNLFQVLKK
ncbi:MAG: fused MFS/spermidine synthase [Anaerolineales bacterium]|nr:fused MFS/spermidine synthase [Anaerolineales bacterium]